MTPETTTPAQHISAERADLMTRWWPRSNASPIKSRIDRDQIEAGIKLLSHPCDQRWLMARVLALLFPYYAADVPEGIRVMDAEDWRASLRDYPQWAIEKSVRWWKSDENDKRAKKPVEGDILARVKHEMGILAINKIMVSRFSDSYREREREVERVAPTPDELERRRVYAEQVVQDAGYGFKTRPKGPMRETVTAEDLAEIAELMAKHTKGD